MATTERGPATTQHAPVTTGPASISAERAAVRRRLADARLYLCTDARTDRGDRAAFAAFVRTVLRAGVDIIQLRDRSLDIVEELELLALMVQITQEEGALLAVNDRADVATVTGAHILHTGQRDLPVGVARGLVGPGVGLGRSTSGAEQAAAADADPDVDYFCVGPVHATPTKPGRAAVGVEAVRRVAEAAPTTPWFAIGGIEPATLAPVLDAGARRVVVVRAITDAADPGEAARTIRAAVVGA